VGWLGLGDPVGKPFQCSLLVVLYPKEDFFRFFFSAYPDEKDPPTPLAPVRKNRAKRFVGAPHLAKIPSPPAKGPKKAVFFPQKSGPKGSGGGVRFKGNRITAGWGTAIY